MLIGGSIDGRKADVWGTGLLLFELMSLSLLYHREGIVGARALNRAGVLDDMVAEVRGVSIVLRRAAMPPCPPKLTLPPAAAIFSAAGGTLAPHAGG